jgi:hypothetical protein
VVAFFSVGEGGGRLSVAFSFIGEVDWRAAAWGLPICLIKVDDLGFLLCEDGDLFEVGLS